jgi:hypothetical protein
MAYRATLPAAIRGKDMATIYFHDDKLFFFMRMVLRQFLVLFEKSFSLLCYTLAGY